MFVALIGKEERNKDFTVHLAEDNNGNAIGPEDVQATGLEQGHGDNLDKEKVPTSDEQ